MIDNDGYTLPTDATTSYYVNPIDLATDPIDPDLNWSVLGTSGMIDRNGGCIRLFAPDGAVNPSWNIEIKVVYLPNDQATDRVIDQIMLSTVNENTNSTGTPVGTVIQATAPPFNGIDPLSDQFVTSQFTLTSPGTITGDPTIVYPAIRHDGETNTAPTLYELTLNAYYTGDVPNYVVVQPTPP